MLRIKFLFASFLLSLCSLAQQSPVISIKGSFDVLLTDNLNHLYLTKNNSLYKYDESGKLLFSSEFRMFGDITYVDVSNPMEIMVFYRDQNVILFLDNTLSEITTTDLSDLDITEALVCCRSSDNGIWVLDANDLKLKKIQTELSVEKESESIANFVFGSTEPSFLTEQNRFIYMCIPSEGVLMFDNFGTYFKKLPITGIEHISVLDNNIYFFKDGSFHKVNILTLDEKIVSLPLENSLIPTIVGVKTGKKILVHSVQG